VQHTGSGPGNLGPHPHSVNLSPDNRYALAADLGLDEVRVYRFDQDHGSLTPNQPPLVHTPANSGARHLSFHPSGTIAYVIEELGSSITAMRWDAKPGVLTPIATVSTLPADSHIKSGAAEVLVRPDGRFLYASSRGPNILTVFSIDAATSQLTPIQYVPTQGKQPRNFRIDPSGKYVFVANAETNNVVQFRADPNSGLLAPTGFAFHVVGPTCIKFAPAK
jgi:6-phosphogluconolactonase